MKRSLKTKYLTMCLASSLFVSAVPVYAQPYGYIMNDERGNIGLSTVPPVNFTRSISKPKEVWTGGIYYFEGQANNSKLFTNYSFTGKTSYTINVENNKDKVLKVRVLGKTYKIPANESSTINISTKSTQKFYITFYAPSDFSGYIY